ncbi:MAG: GNAT family N-acetyltransferase [Acidobacteriota bacterium]
MTDVEFEAYLPAAIESYAAEQATAGYWTVEDSVERAEKAFAAFLPDGLATPGQRLLSIVEGGEVAGVLWVGDRADHCFIYDLEIGGEFRGRGLGKAALRHVEAGAAERGQVRVALQVFAHNEAARGLYEATGYETKALLMSKHVGPSADRA